MDRQKLIIGKQEFTYNLKVSRRAKYMRLQVSPEKGLELIIPVGISFREAEKFLITKKDWVLKYLNRYGSRKNVYMFLGRKIEVEHQHDMFLKKHSVELKDNILKITSPAESTVSVNNLYNAWLKLRAFNFIPERVYFLARKYGFKINKVSIRAQKTRWGSCSRGGNLSFNYKLMAYSESVIDYVIIHELCHLIELNHSKKFWSLVEKYLPDYKYLRKELKKLA